MDSTCNDCGYTRTAPGHSYSYSWVDVATSSTCEKYVATCTKCGYSYVVSYDYTHNYSDCTDSTCNDCGYTRTAPGHSYSYIWENVATSSICQRFVARCSVCGYSYLIEYNYYHNYSDCTDSTCNNCGYTRTAPGHSYSYFWEDVATSSICERYVARCTKCGYSYVISYDYTHNYSDNCTDTTCNDCGYTRTAPGHSYSYSWVSVSTASICQKYVATCTKCGYSYVVSYDYTHYYPSSNTQVCRDCGYVR